MTAILLKPVNDVHVDLIAQAIKKEVETSKTLTFLLD